MFLAYLQRSVAEFAPKPLFQTVLQFAKRTEEALKNSMLHGSRKKPPSVMEIKAAISGMPLYCRVVLPNGKEKAVEIKSTATSSDVIKKVSTAIDLKDYGGWSIFETHHETMRQLTAGEYLCDTFTDWEENQRTSLKFTVCTQQHRGFWVVLTLLLRAIGRLGNIVSRNLKFQPQKSLPVSILH